MDIQKLVLPTNIDKTEEALYIRLNKAKICKDGTVKFKKDGKISFDTYFNGFSTGKWLKYTVINEVQLSLQLEGEFEVSLFHAVEVHSEIKRKLLSKKNIKSSTKKYHIFDFGSLAVNGIFYFGIRALSDNSILYDGEYITKDIEATQQVKIAIDICTFKREEYVKRNIELINSEILKNPDSVLYEKLIVNISDNASSLEGIVESNEYIKVRPNANLGGVGGFTRGIIETNKVKDKLGITHLLIMDDDASISISAIEKTYLMLSYLKEEYFGYTIGGELLKLDKKYIQYEAGACWNKGYIKALKHLYDLRDLKNVINNEIEEKNDYAGWWYCCIPLREINMDNLPLPIFIHRDDIEYGIRVGRERFIFMNGICIWHEAFEGKMPGVLEYYDIRNLAILNAIHFPDYSKFEFKMLLLKWASINIAKYRYKYVDYNIRAVEDFCKGIDWLMQQDGEKLHKELLAVNYKAKKVEEYKDYKELKDKDFNVSFDGDYKLPLLKRVLHLVSLNGYILPGKHSVLVTSPYDSVYKLFRSKEVLVLDAYGNVIHLKRSFKELLKTYKRLLKAFRHIDKYYDKAKQGYKNRYNELTNINFWEKYLGL